MRIARRALLTGAPTLGVAAALGASISRNGIPEAEQQSTVACRKTGAGGLTRTEPIIDPMLPIIDTHHHLWILPESFFHSAGREPMRSYAHYLLEDFLADVLTGHNVLATVYMEADPMRPMYRREGPEDMKSLGEVEFANGTAAMAASGIFGHVHACAAIIGHAELERGEATVDKILESHLQAGGGRYRGIRQPTISSGVPHLLIDKRFRSGFRSLLKMGLSFEALVRAEELPELIDLAQAFPAVPIILNHCGGPGRDRFSEWRNDMRAVAGCPNVAIKLGGLGMRRFQPTEVKPPFGSEKLALTWKPYIETCVEAFGTERCMFESNFPMDSVTCSYAVLWNTFKRLASGASVDEKAALFSGTAAKIYRLNVGELLGEPTRAVAVRDGLEELDT